MIDYFALALTHALILIALIRIVGDDRLDNEPEMDKSERLPRRRPDKGGTPDA